jgi:hypothetical protein
MLTKGRRWFGATGCGACVNITGATGSVIAMVNNQVKSSSVTIFHHSQHCSARSALTTTLTSRRDTLRRSTRTTRRRASSTSPGSSCPAQVSSPATSNSRIRAAPVRSHSLLESGAATDGPGRPVLLLDAGTQLNRPCGHARSLDQRWQDVDDGHRPRVLQLLPLQQVCLFSFPCYTSAHAPVSSGFGTSTVDVRVTSVTGQQIVEKNIPISSGTITTGSSQFKV